VRYDSYARRVRSVRRFKRLPASKPHSVLKQQCLKIYIVLILFIIYKLEGNVNKQQSIYIIFHNYVVCLFTS